MYIESKTYTQTPRVVIHPFPLFDNKLILFRHKYAFLMNYFGVRKNTLVLLLQKKQILTNYRTNSYKVTVIRMLRIKHLVTKEH